MQYCNWVQALEGDIDQSHVVVRPPPGRRTTPAPAARVSTASVPSTLTRASPALDTEYGVLIGAQRDAGDDERLLAPHQFLLPYWSMTGPYGENPSRQTRAWVPMDDETVMVYSVTFHPLRPLTDDEIARMRAGSGAGYVGEANFLPPTSAPGGAWRPKASQRERLFPRPGVAADRLFTGIPEFWAQDAAMQEGIGPHLRPLARAPGHQRPRHHQRAAAHPRRGPRARGGGAEPPGVRDPEVYQVRGAAALLPHAADWLAATADLRRVLPGVNPAGV